MKQRPVALIPLSQHFSIRYFVLTGMLQQLQEHLDCILVLAWHDPELMSELETYGARCMTMPTPEKSPRYDEIRRWLNAVWERDLATPTIAIDRRRARQIIHLTLRERLFYLRGDARRHAALLAGATPLGRGRIESLEHRFFETDTNWRAYQQMFADTGANLIISATPFIGAEAFFCRAGRQAGLKTIATILSFDNLTSRGKIETTFDHYSVWNRYMQQEVTRIYGVPAEHISVDGAPQMDFYAWPDIVSSRESFLRRYGLDGSRPIILFGSGAEHITPVEPHNLVQLDQIVNTYPAEQRPQILLRPHPVDDLARWQSALAQCHNVIVSSVWTVTNHAIGRITLEDVRLLATTLAHTDIHVSTSSTMSLDGAIFDKPQIGLAYDDRPGHPFDRTVRELYAREHYLPLTHSGGMTLVYSRDELAQSLQHYLKDPTRDREARAAMVRDVCGGLPGMATANVARTVLTFAATHFSDRMGRVDTWQSDLVA
jgi:hypothetical protein